MTASDTTTLTTWAATVAMAAPTVRPPFLRSPQPICWPSKIVVPMAKLLTRLVSVIMICEPVDTADTSAGEANLPTMSRSTAPYIACKNRVNSTGSAKTISGCKILPWTKVFSCCFSISHLVCVVPQQKAG